MKLQSIQVKNYRSIEDVAFNTQPRSDGSFTFGLVGVNEAGKSSILKALAIKDGLIKLNQKDFRDKTKDVEVLLTYKLDADDASEMENILGQDTELESAAITAIIAMDFVLTYSCTYIKPTTILVDVSIPALKSEDKYDIEQASASYISSNAHQSIFWTAEDRYLISQPINLAAFSANPDGVSIPLRNCFRLAGIEDIAERISSLGNDSTEIEFLQNELGEKVTEHIKNVWPNHPIIITFHITNGLIHFHVKDSGSKDKAKTADQRSDGFKQFISFLLTISAQDRNDELSNSILLLDEPETHLHPQAQEYLLGELISITKNTRNNIAVFATHSNYMIDKDDLGRNHRISKSHGKTIQDPLDGRTASYASVTYEVFGIPSNDYHNELFSRLHSNYQDESPEDEKRNGIKYFDVEVFQKMFNLSADKPWRKTPKQISLPTFIRNCINHPDNGDSFTAAELKKSIDFLRTKMK